MCVCACVRACLYGSQSWTLYRRNIKQHEKFRLHSLRRILRIHWSERVTNSEVLKRSGMTGIECMITKQQLQWVGHVTRMNGRRLPKQVFYGQLLNAKRRTGGQKLRYKDMLRHHLQNMGIYQDYWESLASDRLVWRKNVSSGLKNIDNERMKKLEERRHIHQQMAQGVISSQYVCTICHRDFHSRVGLYAHEQAHNDG